MFSGKTATLIRWLVDAEHLSRPTLAMRPAIDTRSPPARIQTHDGVVYPAVAVAALPNDGAIPPGSAIGIDEAHFFGEELVPAALRLAAAGADVCVAGLDLDYLVRPFEGIARLIEAADVVERVHATCFVCGEPATLTLRLSAMPGRYLVGGMDLYQPRCRRHHPAAADLSSG
jgi:thymidine kinase